ncbi:MAG: DUF456 domain-containing protein [Chloroflexota bacterium]
MIEFLGDALGIAFPWVILVIASFGLFGLVVPIFPGNVIIWAATLIFALVTGFDTRAAWFFIPISLLTIAAVAADNLFMGGKARQAGASWRGIAIALITAFSASLVLTPIAGLLLAPLALYIHEFFRLEQNGSEAWQVTRGLMLGCGWAFFTRFALGVIQVGLYAWWAFGG